MSEEGDASKAAHAALLRWAGLETTSCQFDQYREAAPHVTALLRRVPRQRSRWDDPANVFVFPPEKAR